MAGQWNAWLAALKAAGKGGANYPQLTIDRGLPYSKTIAFAADLSAGTFAASLRSSPDAASVLVNFTISVGAYADGVTPVTLSLTNLQTAALPADGDLDGEERFVFDLLQDNHKLLAGTIPVVGKVTNAL